MKVPPEQPGGAMDATLGAEQEDYEAAVRNALKTKYGDDTDAAFRSLHDDNIRSTFEAVRPHFGASDAELHEDVRLHTAYVEGQRHAHNAHLAASAGGVPAARLPFTLLNDPVYRAYYAGRVHFRTAHLSPEELQAGLAKQFAGSAAGHGTADQVIRLIQHYDSSGFVCQDGRLFVDDFARFFLAGADKHFATLERVAQEVGVGAAGEQSIRARRKVQLQTSRLGRLEDARSKAAAREAHEARLTHMLTQRIERESAVLERRRSIIDARLETGDGEVGEGEGGGAARVELHIAESRGPAAEAAPAIGLVIRTPEPSLAATLAALERVPGQIEAADLRLAFSQRGVPVTSTELTLLARAYAAPGLEGGSKGTVIDYPALLRALGGPGGVTTAEAAQASLASWQAATRSAVEALEGRPADLEDLTARLVFQPLTAQDVSITDELRRYSVAGFGHPIFHASTVLKVVAALTGPTETFRKLLRSMDRFGDGAIARTDLLYVLKAARIPPKRLDAIIDAFPAGPPPTAPPGSKEKRLLYTPFMLTLSPSWAELAVEKAALGLPVSDPRHDGELDAALAEISAHLWSAYVRLRAIVAAKAEPGAGAIAPEDLSEAMREAGVDGWEDERDEAFVLRHFHAPTERLLMHEVLLDVIGTACVRQMQPF